MALTKAKDAVTTLQAELDRLLAYRKPEDRITVQLRDANTLVVRGDTAKPQRISVDVATAWRDNLAAIPRGAYNEVYWAAQAAWRQAEK